MQYDFNLIDYFFINNFENYLITTHNSLHKCYNDIRSLTFAIK